MFKLSGLSEGTLRLKKDGKFKEAQISGGFIQVDKEQAVIITESADWK